MLNVNTTILRRVAILLLGMVLALCITLSGTFAAIMKGESNQPAGLDAPEYRVRLILYVRDINGEPTTTPIPDTQFLLYEVDPRYGPIQIDGIFPTSDKGEITRPLTVGDYYFEEYLPRPGYTYDLYNNGDVAGGACTPEQLGQPHKKYPFTVVPLSGNQFQTVIAYNIPMVGTLNIKKIILGANNQHKADRFTFAVDFFDKSDELGQASAGVEVEAGNPLFQYTLNVDTANPKTLHELTADANGKLRHLALADGEVATFPNLPNGLYYLVSEEDLSPKNYTYESTGNKGNIVSGETKNAEFINTYTPTWFELHKTVISEHGTPIDPNKEFSFTLKLDLNEDGSYADAGAVKEIFSFTMKHGEFFHTNPSYHDLTDFRNILDGIDVPEGTKYILQENLSEAEKAHYTAVQSSFAGVIHAGKNEIFFTNHLDTVTAGQKGWLRITKELWEDKNTKNLPFDIKVKLSNEPDEHIVTLTPNTTTGYSTRVALFGATNNDIPAGTTFEVTEVDGQNGYSPISGIITGTILADRETEVKVVNKKTDTAVLTIAKILDGNFPAEHVTRAFKFGLTIDEQDEQVFELIGGSSKQFTLPLGSKYEIREIAGNGESNLYYEGYSQTSVNASGVILKNTEASIRNTWVGIPKIHIFGEKTWDTLGTDAAPPTKISVSLKNGDVVVETKEVTPNEDGHWLYSFEAYRYDAEGKEIAYTIEEAAVAGFAATYAPEQIVDDPSTPDVNEAALGNKKINIKNTLVAPVTFDMPLVRKIITGSPEKAINFDFMLESKLGTEPLPNGGTGRYAQVHITGSGESSFNGAVTFRSPGVYSYTIVETNNNVSGYTYDDAVYSLVVTVSEENGALKAEAEFARNGEVIDIVDRSNYVAAFTNVFNPDDASEPPSSSEDPNTPLVTIKGKKSWQHQGNVLTEQPKEITVYVFAGNNTQPVAQLLVNEKSGWEFSTKLPKNDNAGNEITYIVKEGYVKDYQPSYNGYNILNIYTPGYVPPGDDPGDSSWKSNIGDKEGQPYTGENNVKMTILGVIMFLSAAGIVFLVIIDRKKKRAAAEAAE